MQLLDFSAVVFINKALVMHRKIDEFFYLIFLLPVLVLGSISVHLHMPLLAFV